MERRLLVLRDMLPLSTVNSTFGMQTQHTGRNDPSIVPSPHSSLSSSPSALLASTQQQKNISLLNIDLQTLCQHYCLTIPCTTTIRSLIDIIWRDITFHDEHYTQESHILLLFNPRLHIFVQSNPKELVNDFLSILKRSSTNHYTDFYIYGLPIEANGKMYDFESDIYTVLRNADSWQPLYFNDCKQLPRPQSIFLSSLFALKQYFKPEDKLTGIRAVMEAQFFLLLRKWLFPPAILALKHAIEGSMFWFEKALIMDALLQLLKLMCPERVYSQELCDFIPFLFSWLLEQCDPTIKQEDWFQLIQLIDSNKNERSYFQNPVTTSKAKRKALFLEEFDGIHSHNDVQRHVDIRSLTLYLTKTTNHRSNFACQCDHYAIYDSIDISSSIMKKPARWTQVEMDNHYETMAHKYPWLMIITRGALNANVNNQLALLNNDRTVSLVFSPQKVMRPHCETRQNAVYFFHIFDPFRCSKVTPYLTVEANEFVNEQQDMPDPRLPVYFNSNLCVEPTIQPFSNRNPSQPAHQVTVILLDHSQSMYNCRIVSPDGTNELTHIDMAKAMLGILNDNLISAIGVHVVGLVEFATEVKVTCSITRNHDEFEKALESVVDNREWTCMYDALNVAICMIKTFVSSPLRAERNCRKLIICLSDGINNHGETTIEQLHKLVKRNNVVIDFVSFLRDNQMKTSMEIRTVQEFRVLCEKSGGYIYRNLRLLSNIELAAMFEQEAAVSLSKRAWTSHGVVDKPERHVPSMLEEEAVDNPLLKENPNHLSRIRRILNEINEIKSQIFENIIVYVVRSSIEFWKVILKGPSRTPYENRYWMVYVEFNPRYPNYAPDVRFHKPIYHVNISGDGKICHQIFDQAWSKNTKMIAVFENILDLLKTPNFTDAMSIEKAALYRDNPNEYGKQAIEHSRKYAKHAVEDLKREYKLECDQ
ncbi:unnamed protein product [Rotaria sp. Silwood2]|nr:unnamed protein product [Rotaria sp. Silwood2]CAF4499518.1 unnamed protein product [Rotaria sp. Silwood2]